MTALQNQAIEEVRRIMKANFDSFILTYRITDEHLKTRVNHDWHGDVVDIVGLAAMTNHRMMSYTDLRDDR